ncbi:MAG: LamG domain-containing protein, partial [Methanosarcinaceae archaeon]
DSDSDTEYQLQHGNGNSKFEVAVRTDDRRRYVKSTTSPEVNEWYYVVGTYSSFDEELSIYVNGVKERSRTHTGHIHISSDDLFIGERGDNSRYFTGVIDEVRVSDRRLTDTQILARYELFNGSAPTLSGQTPSTPHSSNTTTSVTFSATSDQSSNNEFLLNGTHVSWSNGTSPSYTNSSATVGSYNLTLIAHSSTKAALTDSMTWTWNVSEECTYADQIILNKPTKGGIIKDGGYISFTNDGNYRYVDIGGTRHNLNAGDFVKLEIVNDQTSGELDMNIGSSQITTFNFNVNLHINGNLEDSGQVTSIYVKPISDYDSTLRYELPSYSSQMYLEVNGSIVIPWSPNNSSAVNISNIGFYNPGITRINFNPSSTYLQASGYWTISEKDDKGHASQWLLDENSGTNAYDSIGNNDGTIHGAIWTTGISNSALSFDGLNDHVAMNDSIIHDYPFTVVAWINTSASGKDQTIISLADSSVDNSYYGIYIDHPRGIAIRARNTAVRTKYGSANVTDGQWHHVVGVFAAENDRKLYVDGVLNASTTIGVTFNSNVDRWNIGRWADSTPKSYFEGIIDEVHVNNTAWTADDVASHYAATSPEENSGFVSQWSMDENTGTITYDSADGNDGTIHGATWATGANNSALSFDGNNDHVKVLDSNNLDITDSITIIGWVKATDGSGGVSGSIIDKGWDAFSLVKDKWGGWKVTYRISNSNQAVQWDWGKEHGRYPSDGQWYHVAATYNGSRIVLYIDGVMDNSKGVSGMLSTSDRDMMIGCNQGNSNFFDGMIDELAIYDRALSAEEIQHHYSTFTIPYSVSCRVNASNDDAEERVSNGYMYRYSSDLELVRDGSDQEIGIRFTNVAIPQGSTIGSANLVFVIDEEENRNTDLNIYGHDIDDSPEFDNDDYDITNRTKTTSYVQWDDLPAPAVGETLESPDVSAVIQEVINRPGWSSGNSLSIIINGSGRRTVESYSGVPDSAPLLNITYT